MDKLKGAKYFTKMDIDEVALSLALEIARLHNSSQLRSYTNYPRNCIHVTFPAA